MTSENTALVIELTQSILEQFWQRDPALMLKYIDDDFSLMDVLNQYLIIGRDNIYNFLQTVIGAISKSTISDGEFHVAQNCGSACTIIGKYTLTPTDDEEGMLRMNQHCVFVWEMAKNGEIKLKHIGVSKPDSAPAPTDYGASFRAAVCPPGSDSTSSAQAQPADRMIITDTDDCTRFIPRSSILYVTSDGRNTRIHCFSGNINARLSISAFLENAGNKFFPIHRCYAINLDYITLLKPYCVIMSDGSEIPVPVKRYSEIKQQLTKLISN